MADLFISYSQKDRYAAKSLADRLIASGLSVWWDTQLVGGEAFRDAIQEQLAAARIVAVLWSENSLNSRYVMDEADEAASTGKILSLLLDGFEPHQLPLGFRTFHSIRSSDLAGINNALAKRGLAFRVQANSSLNADADKLRRRGEAIMNQLPYGNFDDAMRLFDQAVDLDSRAASAYFSRGKAHNYKGNRELAIRDLTRAIELDPAFADAFNERGEAYLHADQVANAIIDYTAAINLRPSFVDAYVNRGTAFEWEGNHGKAIQDFSKAIALQPDNAIALLNRGNLYELLGKMREAEADLRKAGELVPAFKRS